MASQILFMEKSKCDLDNINCTITITDAIASSTGDTIIDFIRNRSNDSSWLTTGSTDAANTELLVDIGDNSTISDIILMQHNWASYTVQYWTGSAYADFTPAISETGTIVDTTHHTFADVNTNRIKIIIGSTQTVDADKQLSQLVITKRFGSLAAWPTIKNPLVSLNKRKSRMLSGKTFVTETTGYFACDLEVKILKSDADLTIVENIFMNRQGLLLWLCGGDQDQFSSIRMGYRLKDLYLVRPTNEWKPEWYKGLYTSGMKINIKLEESID